MNAESQRHQHFPISAIPATTARPLACHGPAVYRTTTDDAALLHQAAIPRHHIPIYDSTFSNQTISITHLPSIQIMPTIPSYFQTAMPPTTPASAPPPSSSSTTNTTSDTSDTNNTNSSNITTTTHPLPPHPHTFPHPTLRLHLNDLPHEGTSLFLTTIHGAEDLSAQLQTVLSLLYASPSSPRPGTRSVTLVLRAIDGVAYTTGTELDDDHKEIHLNVNYVVKASKSKPSLRQEILGVIMHELVHCFQHNARGTCPGGLIEGIADFVRLRAGLGAAHWRREAEGKWDRGYQHTGYFLDWLERKFGEGTIRRMNACLRDEEGEWEEGRVFGRCCAGRSVEGLWEEYREELKREKDQDGMEEGEETPEAVPTHAAVKQ